MSLSRNSQANTQRLRATVSRSYLWIFVAVLALIIFLILAINLVIGPQVEVVNGQPAPEDVVAPRSVTYVSDILTDRARQQAAASVADQFTPIDLSIARAQNNWILSVFGFIDVVRADTMADNETKIAYLQEIDGLSIAADIAADLLALNQNEFFGARDNILQIVEDTMRQGVVEDQLGDARRKAALGADFDLTPAQDRVVETLAPQFITPNIFFDEALTSELQAQAMADVEPISQIVTEGQRVLRVGDIVDDVDIEMLEQLGLLQRQLDWRRAISAGLASLLAVTVATLYWNQFFSHRKDTARSLAILGILLSLFLISANLLMSSRTIYSYLYPAAALSILVAVIFDVRLAIMITIVQAGLVGYIATQQTLEVTVFTAAGGILAILTLRDAQRINALFRAGLVAAIGNVAVILIFGLLSEMSATELLTLILFGVINGAILSSGLSLVGIYIIGSVFGIVTPLQLQELSRLDHPLLQELLRRAPGTYHHSIMVANLAEQASEKIQANSPLVRVGAFYHDVGKMNRPPFFSENQNGGNPHDNLDPYSSARIILSHVTDGLELARQFGLPNRIRDFIAEHHGDRVLKTFYQKARGQVADGEEVDIARFRYRGPRPRSRETGIVQLADSIEATSSALRPSTEEEIEKLVTTIIEEHLKEGQLDDAGLTLGDIKILRESFIKTVKGRFHMRVRYPGNELITGEVRQVAGDSSHRSLPAPATDLAAGNESLDETVVPIAEELDEPIRN